MSIPVSLALPAVGLALAAQPAMAQESIPYETGQYEYAQPEPVLDDDVVTETITEEPEAEKGAARVIPMRRSGPEPVFVENPVVQPVTEGEAQDYAATPAATTLDPVTRPTAVASTAPAAADLTSVPGPAPILYTYPAAPAPAPVIYAYPAPYGHAQPAGGAARVIYRDAPPPAARMASGAGYGPGQGGAVDYLPAGAQLVAFDRTGWLEECRARLDTYEDESERGRVIGALVGAAAGGVIGNRVAGSGERTAGTLIGAGTGALAGMAVGDAVADRDRGVRDSYGQCQAYLDDYMQQATANAGRVHYTQPGQYMLIPVTVMVPQRAVYRDGTPVE